MLDALTAPRRPKAADIADDLILASVRRHMRNIGAMTWDIADDFPEFPVKVVRAKLGQLKKRRILDGCACNCRGDWSFVGED